jgi:ribosomal protein S25
MGRRADTFFDELLDKQIVEAVNNDFGRAIMKLPNQGNGEVRDEVHIYFSAVAIQQVNAIATKYGITDSNALNELYQLTRTNLIQGFRIGQRMGNTWTAS